ncbi:BPSL0067 family protein [Vineibacter terrae]|uniref:BPSL0067 family protein n=1 Tax=Vineibacter terrae TaxID=2586908 RepID=A0A5C8PBD3_9HYPH|nr:BPSL0067 family protein [Vineibacter terrae]TXL70879.1 BPSL0067 family protein [Vineibacter terrae]
MPEVNTSLTELFRQQGLGALARIGAMTAVAAALSNSATAARQGFLQNVAQRGKMWVIKGFEKLEGRVVGSGQCPGIVQSFGGLPLTAQWFEGPKVRGNPYIPYGTAVATFKSGRYANQKHGNHVAIYISQNPDKGVLVFDQWTNRPAGYRYMKFLDGDGTLDPSNNGAALSIILTPKDG